MYSLIIFNLSVFTRVALLTDPVYQMQRCPCDHRDDPYLHKEQSVYVARVEVLLKKHDRHKVNDSSGDLYQEHLKRQVIDLCVDI